jgi:hypothetical protein
MEQIKSGFFFLSPRLHQNQGTSPHNKAFFDSLCYVTLTLLKYNKYNTY